MAARLFGDGLNDPWMGMPQRVDRYACGKVQIGFSVFAVDVGSPGIIHLKPRSKLRGLGLEPEEIFLETAGIHFIRPTIKPQHRRLRRRLPSINRKRAW